MGEQRPFSPVVQVDLVDQVDLVGILITYACVFIVSWKSRICCQASSGVSA